MFRHHRDSRKRRMIMEDNYALRKRYVFNLRLKDESEVAARTSFGRSFHIVGASKLKLLPNCFGDL